MRHRGSPKGTAHGEHEGRGGKRLGRRALNSAATTKDLNTGELSSSVSQSDIFPYTDTLSTMHSNIPPPHVSGWAFTTSTRPSPVLESTNRYSILLIEDTNDSSLGNDAWVVRAPPKLTKRPASNSSRVKASNKKTTTILSPILTTTRQLRPPLEEFQAAVTNARSDGAERALSAKTSDEAALLDGKVPPRGSSHTASSEGIAVESETSPGTERNARWSKSKSPGNAEASTNMAPTTSLPSRDQSWGLRPQKHELLTTEGRSRTPNETRIPTGPQGPTQAGEKAAKLVSPPRRLKSSPSPPQEVAKVTLPGNALPVLYPPLERTTRRPATPPVLVPAKRRRKGLPQGRKLLAPRQ